MAILSDSIREQVAERFQSRLQRPVELRLYLKPGSGRLILPQGLGCPTCDDARRLVEELVSLAPERLTLTVVDVTAETPPPEVEDIPFLTAGRPGEPHRIRFLGAPAGFEFGTLVEALEELGGAEREVQPETVEALQALDTDVELMVFTTPTCRYCPAAVALANTLAVASPRVTALTVAANDFPRLSAAFGVQGVPRTVVNRRDAFVGALPEEQFVASIQAALERELVEDGAEASGPDR